MSVQPSQGRKQRYAALSLRKNHKKSGDGEIANSSKKFCPDSQSLLDDNFFDNVNLTQILQNSTMLTPKSSEDIDPFNDSFEKGSFTQLFPTSQKLPEVKSENFGDVLTQTNRDKIDTFFNAIEHSVSVLGEVEDTNDNVTRILEALSTQAVNLNKSLAYVTEEQRGAALSTLNESFAVTLKKMFLENCSKKVVSAVKTEETIVKEEVKGFTEIGPFYGLPLRVKELIKLYKGIDDLYDWQNECLNLPAIKDHKNLIYALPTSGGKTLVSEILMIREIMCYKRNAIFILPYVAIVQEKVWGLSPFAVALDFLVEEYAASKGTYPPRKRRRKKSIYIATIEKALGLVNSLIETDRLNEIGLVVIDELHLIGEEGRGGTLEGLLTKIMFSQTDVQIVGMSATIGNVGDLCNFLRAEVYEQNFRPVELIEYVKCGPEIAKVNYTNQEEELLTVARKMSDKVDKNDLDPDKLGTLVMEVLPSDSCLIFCHSKKNCENVAYLLCKVLDKTLLEHKKDDKIQIKHALKDEGGSLCKILNLSIQYGVAYHHSGLTNEERRIIEDGFRAGVISVICCTSTLAAGVNLPAKRVILRQPYIGKDFITLSKYKQMVGRAGRAGLGESGESILICNVTDLEKVKELLKAPMDEALSGMHKIEAKGLSCISLGVAKTRSSLREVCETSLLHIQRERLKVDTKKLTDKVIKDLFKLGAIQEADLKKNKENINCDVTIRMENSFVDSFSEPTTTSKKKIILNNSTSLTVSKLGAAATKGNFELTRAQQLYDDLHEAQKSLVLLDCLHLLYLVTPYETAEQVKPNKIDYYNIYCKLEPSALHTAKILGINEAVAMKLLANQPIRNVHERVLNRFYLALMLYDLWNEKPVFEVSAKFQINRGIVQNLMTSAASFASNVVHFCEELEEFWTFAHLLKGMSQRLSHCCIKELVPLMELPAVKQSRARQLYNAGFKSIRNIAAANPDSLSENIEFMSRRVAKQLIAAAKMLLLEKVENLRDEAEDVLEGVDNPKPDINHSFLR